MHFLFRALLSFVLCAPFLFLSAQQVGDPIPLITHTDQLSSPHSDSQEGTDIGALIDGDPYTFWHSDWHNEKPGDEHWVEIALDEPVQGLVALYMHRRSTENDHPTRIRVEGSDDGTQWTALATVDLPYSGFGSVLTDPWTVKEKVRYIRLVVTDCAGGSGFRKFWHASEIQLYYLSGDLNYSSSIEGVQINEVQVANIDMFLDGSCNYGPWIEIYNPTDALCTMNGARLRHTDADGVVKEASFGPISGMLSPGGFKTIWFDHNAADGSYGGTSSQHIPFKLDPEGGQIELIDNEGNVVESLNYPPSIVRCAWARTEDGGNEWGWTANPTPGKSNAASTFATERLDAPVVNKKSGVFKGSVSFKVEIPAGTTLRYTTDGSAPSATNGFSTTMGSFTTFTTKVFRFMLVADDKLPSPVITRTFLKDELALSLPILHVSSHPDHFYDPIIGVYTRGKNGVSGKGQDSPCNWNMDWERPVNMEYLVPGEDGYESMLNQESTFKVAGGWSRAYGGGNGWEMKSSFRLKSGREYEGMNAFNYPFFPDNKAYNKYKTLQVRNGGNDTYSRTIDPAVQEIIRRSGFYVDTQAWQPCHVFFNGRYLGMFNIRENNNRFYGVENYGIDDDDIDQFEYGATGYMQNRGTSEVFDRWHALTKQLAAAPSPAIWEEICTLLDVDEFCNYMAAECWMGSNDWLTNCNNIKGFRARDDGKIHFVMFDADQVFSSRNMLGEIANLYRNYDGRFSANDGRNSLADIFINMLSYAPFQQQFVNAYCIFAGSVMEPARCRTIIDEMTALTDPALALEGNSSKDKGNWVYNAISNESQRSERMNSLRNFFNLKNEYQLRLEANIPEGRLLVDAQEIPTRKFSGSLFAPATLCTAAPAGYEFVEWQIVSNSAAQNQVFDFKSQWQYYDQGSQDNTTWKTFGGVPNGWKTAQAPFGYGTVGTKEYAADYHTTLDYGPNSSNKRPTYYFRKTIQLANDPSHEDRFYLYGYVDDGVIFYLNGEEVATYNCASGSSYNTYATATVAGTAEYFTLEIPAGKMRKGTNILAAEVHNNNAGSSDLFFDARLVRARFETTSLAATQTLSLQDHLAPGNYRIVAVYRPISSPLALLESGASPVRINELSAANDIHVNDYFKRNDWIELYNTTAQPVDIEGMYLSDKRNNPQKYQISSNDGAITTVIPPFGTIIIWADKLNPVSQLHAPFKLENADGASVLLQAKDGTWADEIVYVEQDRWQTFGRYPDGGSHAQIFNRPTINMPNIITQPDFAAHTQTAPQAEADMAITLALVEGWNWTSHNLCDDVHTSRFTTFARQIAGSGNDYTLDEDGTWSGKLKALEAAQGYKVDMAQAADITLRGLPFDTHTPVAVATGWNWLGCPLYARTTIETALANYLPAEGDALVGLEGFSVYHEGEWHGTLQAVSPGQAYMLRAEAPQQFCWTAVTQPTRRARRYEAPAMLTAIDAPWTVNPHAYPNVQSMVARLEVNGTAAVADNFALAAFSGDECRGIAQMVDSLLYLNIHGIEGEPLHFVLVDAEGQTIDIDQQLLFAPQSILGTPAEPYLLTIGGTGIHTPTTAGQHPVSIAYFLPDGQQVAKPAASGVCLKQMRYRDGKTITTKILK